MFKDVLELSPGNLATMSSPGRSAKERRSSPCGSSSSVIWKESLAFVDGSKSTPASHFTKKGGDFIQRKSTRRYAARSGQAPPRWSLWIVTAPAAATAFNSLLPEALDLRCEFVVQNQWTEYTRTLESGCDAALLVGMHAKAGTADGVLSHTVSSTRWYNLSFNGTLVGETGINAALCGTWHCPITLVTGDRATCQEARALLREDVTAAQVKVGFGRYSARHLTPIAARELIEEAAADSLKEPSRVRPYDPGKPCEIRVELADPEDAPTYTKKEAVRLVDPRTVVTEAPDWWTAWRQLYL
jgi:D-amino peptidase